MSSVYALRASKSVVIVVGGLLGLQEGLSLSLFLSHVAPVAGPLQAEPDCLLRPGSLGVGFDQFIELFLAQGLLVGQLLVLRVRGDVHEAAVRDIGGGPAHDSVSIVAKNRLALLVTLVEAVGQESSLGHVQGFGSSLGEAIADEDSEVVVGGIREHWVAAVSDGIEAHEARHLAEELVVGMQEAVEVLILGFEGSDLVLKVRNFLSQPLGFRFKGLGTVLSSSLGLQVGPVLLLSQSVALSLGPLRRGHGLALGLRALDLGRDQLLDAALLAFACLGH